MSFFTEEILENKNVINELKMHPELNAKGKCIAEYIIETKDYPHIEPGLLPIYVLAHLAEYALQKNSERGIPKEITVNTLKDINVWIDNYEKQYGKIGLTEFHWLIFHYTSRLFRLGRLQFQLALAEHQIPAKNFVIETHIPQGEPLIIDNCIQAFQAAADFFREFFPHYKADYFICKSWLINSNLAEILDEESNIVRFMKLWTKYDIPSDNSMQAIERVFGFGFERENIIYAPENTTLQRLLKKHLLSDKALDMSAGYIRIE